jgi:hypothetical protein
LFNPKDLFANGEPGVWYDPSDMSTLFQDSAGTTPVTAVEQPVGLMLDKSKGLVLGPELVTNGDFSNGTTGWTASSSSLSVTAGVMELYASVNFASFFQSFITVVGRRYQVSATARRGTGGQLGLVARTSSNTGNIEFVVSNATSDAVLSFSFIATTTTTFVVCNTTTPGTSYWDNISVRELPGNHAFQSTAASRPVLSARKNILVNTEALATQTRTVRAVGHVLSFWGTGTVTLSGVSTAGPLVGTGTGDRVSLAFTPTAGNLTLTVSGAVIKAQLEEINESL